MGTFTVKLDVRDRGDVLSAVCRDVPGLHVYGATLEAVRQRAMRAIPQLFEKNKHVSVEALPTDDLTVIRVRPV